MYIDGLKLRNVVFRKEVAIGLPAVTRFE